MEKTEAGLLTNHNFLTGKTVVVASVLSIFYVKALLKLGVVGFNYMLALRRFCLTYKVCLFFVQ